MKGSNYMIVNDNRIMLDLHEVHDSVIMELLGLLYNLNNDNNKEYVFFL